MVQNVAAYATYAYLVIQAASGTSRAYIRSHLGWGPMLRLPFTYWSITVQAVLSGGPAPELAPTKKRKKLTIPLLTLPPAPLSFFFVFLCRNRFCFTPISNNSSFLWGRSTWSIVNTQTTVNLEKLRDLVRYHGTSISRARALNAPGRILWVGVLCWRLPGFVLIKTEIVPCLVLRLHWDIVLLSVPGMYHPSPIQHLSIKIVYIRIIPRLYIHLSMPNAGAMHLWRVWH